MKNTLLIIGLLTGLTSQLVAGETLRLKIEPEREWLKAGSPEEIVVKIDLFASAKKDSHHRPPLNIAVVLDRSGSMAGAKIEKARQAAMDVVDRLAPEDIFSLVTYDTQAELVIPPQSVENKGDLKQKIRNIASRGRTALYAGVSMGAEQVALHLSSETVNRVILLSDGLANVGPSSTAELRALGREIGGRGIAVTTIGVGDDYNEDLMAGLAEASDSNYYYVKDTEKLPEIFAKELGGLQSIAARDVRIEIICPEGVKPIGLVGRPERFEGGRVEVLLSQFSPEQTRSLFLRCRVERSIPAIAQVNVRYRDTLDGDASRTIGGSAQVRFTKDQSVAAKSEKPEVVAQKELILTAVVKDTALAEADAGHYQKAAQALVSQALVLENQSRNAPASMQSTLHFEVENLRLRAGQLQQNQYEPGMRKALQSESWDTRNSK